MASSIQQEFRRTLFYNYDGKPQNYGYRAQGNRYNDDNHCYSIIAYDDTFEHHDMDLSSLDFLKKAYDKGEASAIFEGFFEENATILFDDEVFTANQVRAHFWPEKYPQ